IFLFFGSFAIASALSRQGLDEWVANGVLRVGGGNFWVVVGLLFVVTAGLSMWMTNTATTAVMIPLVLGMQGRLGLEKGGKTMVFLLLGVAYSSSLGGLGTIVGTAPNGIGAEALGIGFGEWMRFGIPVVLVMVPVMVGVLFLVLRPESPGRLESGRRVAFEFHSKRVLLLVVFVLTALCWVNGKWLGSLVGVEKGFESLVAVGAVIVLLLVRVVSWEEVNEGMDWGVLLLFGGGLALSGVLKETGASEFLAQGLKGMVEGWPLVLVVGAVVLFVVFLTELSSNTATTAVMVPIFAAVAVELGFGKEQVVLPLVIAASCAFMLPVATPPNAIVFGTGQVDRVLMMRVGVVLNLIMAGVLTMMARVLF
ncbi:MAG: DASS family sodium-coupled anion symporter, partial [Verrucomicrobiota bacterium]